MITNTEEYTAAITGKARVDRVTGTIKLKSGEVITVNDESLVNNILSIDEQICGSRFEIGTFNSAQLKIAVYDKYNDETEQAVLRDFTNAKAVLYYGVKLDDGSWEDIPLGKYIIEGSSVKRKRNKVFLTGFDYSIAFDKNKKDSLSKSSSGIFEALTKISESVRVELSTTEEEINAFPNSGVKISLSDPQLQTNRDCVMWIAALLGCYARINRYGKLEIRKIDYQSDSETGTIYPDWTITGDERIKTSFTDTRTFIKYMTGYSQGKVKQYISALVSGDEQAVEGTFALSQNPIVKDFAEIETDEINKNILSEISHFLQRGIDIETRGNPSLECGDAIMLSGGVLDIGRRIIGVITQKTWRYRQGDRVVCQPHETASSDDNQGAVSRTFGIATFSEESEENETYVTPKSQTEKRIDALYKTLSSGIVTSNNPLSYFGITEDGGCKVDGIVYNWTVNGDGYVETVTDSNQNTFSPDLTNIAQINAETFNGYLLPTIFARGIGKAGTGGGTGGGGELGEGVIGDGEFLVKDSIVGDRRFEIIRTWPVDVQQIKFSGTTPKEGEETYLVPVFKYKDTTYTIYGNGSSYVGFKVVYKPSNGGTTNNRLVYVGPAAGFLDYRGNGGLNTSIVPRLFKQIRPDGYAAIYLELENQYFWRFSDNFLNFTTKKIESLQNIGITRADMINLMCLVNFTGVTDSYFTHQFLGIPPI